MVGKSRLKAKVPLRAKTPLKPATKPKKKPKPTITRLKKEADRLHSLATRYRFAYMKDGEPHARCITCKVEKPIKELQCGHFISRQYNSTRFAEENTAPQCYGCNVMQQGRQYQFSIEVELLYGEGTAKRLLKQSRTPHQFKRQELEDIIEFSTEKVQFYQKQLH